MKKRMFRMLCAVLALALLAPNVVAATPTPEVPLADEATVTRVKNEIATGEITDMEDVFLVAYQHLGADLEEDGMTAYINEDGTLGFTQIISSKKSITRSGEVEEKSIAVTSMALVDNEGNLLSNSGPYPGSFIDTVSGNFADILVYVTHTAYYSFRDEVIGDGTEQGMFSVREIKVTKVITTIAYDSNAFVPTKLVQLYEEVTAPVSNSLTETKTTNSPGRGTFTFIPSIADYHYEALATDNSCHYRTSSAVYIANTNQFLYLETTNNLNTVEDDYNDHQ